MQKYQYLLLDLDGTVTDPMVGITRSVQYALSFFGITIYNLEELCPFIGPPLKDSFKEFYHFTDEQAEEAVQKYREYFSAKGIFENEVYEGMEEFLKDQTQQGKNVMLATSKPEPFAIQILEHFNLGRYFSFIGGSTFDGSRSTKTDVIRYVLDTQDIKDLSKVVMVGDRKHDIEGAKENGVDSVGVLYGYGSEAELKQAGADYIVASIAELATVL
jgi:haloacid dehalogenase superfamily, subfamily IA, variant 1 with third motif having Dx(3-4)D or Dx(3-4)E